MGGHNATPEVEHLAFELGAAIADAGHVLLTGGRNEGVMAAATRGARENGGLTIGIHPGCLQESEPADADIVVFTGLGFARNSINVLSSDAIIALPGAAGTLSEVAYAQTYRKPTALLGFEDNDWFGDSVARLSTVEDAIGWLRATLTKSG
jgi:uncharacterized protein (TIGR00725 family)